MIEPDGELLPGGYVCVKAPEPPGSYKWSLYGKQFFGCPLGPGIRLMGTRLLRRSHILLLPKKFHTFAGWFILTYTKVYSPSGQEE